ncbi:MAG: hypothetical protein CM1200mP30_17520 [Pseudomonadota bacterium]|nr:MAG: hypothetical protein CM1200mP30_17520 [Pseudomonadota bacterium]
MATMIHFRQVLMEMKSEMNNSIFDYEVNLKIFGIIENVIGMNLGFAPATPKTTAISGAPRPYSSTCTTCPGNPQIKTVDKIDIYRTSLVPGPVNQILSLQKKESSAGTPIAFLTPVKSACRLVSKSFINVILKLIVNRLIIWGTFYVEDGIPN